MKMVSSCQILVSYFHHRTKECFSFSRFTDVVDVVQAITNHPNKDIARKLKIGAVTICVDATNTYMTDR